MLILRVLDENRGFSCDPAGTRTQDPYIKSVLLYRLSYRIVFCFNKMLSF